MLILMNTCKNMFLLFFPITLTDATEHCVLWPKECSASWVGICGCKVGYEPLGGICSLIFDFCLCEIQDGSSLILKVSLEIMNKTVSELDLEKQGLKCFTLKSVAIKFVLVAVVVVLVVIMVFVLFIGVLTS